jgi:hypothetical protein
LRRRHVAAIVVRSVSATTDLIAFRRIDPVQPDVFGPDHQGIAVHHADVTAAAGQHGEDDRHAGVEAESARGQAGAVAGPKMAKISGASQAQSRRLGVGRRAFRRQWIWPNR